MYFCTTQLSPDDFMILNISLRCVVISMPNPRDLAPGLSIQILLPAFNEDCQSFVFMYFKILIDLFRIRFMSIVDISSKSTYYFLVKYFLKFSIYFVMDTSRLGSKPNSTYFSNLVKLLSRFTFLIETCSIRSKLIFYS